MICLLSQRKHSAVTAQNHSVVVSEDVRLRIKKGNRLLLKQLKM